jgi:rare lipoprotein A
MRFSPGPHLIVIAGVSLGILLHAEVVLAAPPSLPMLYEVKPSSVELGKASYYGGRWIGRLTADGEHYHSGDYTAAHKKLPFNTMVRVTNLRNGESVIVRINNRGPYGKGRILDLSMAAARQIRMIGAGIVPVRVEVLKPIEVIRKPNRTVPELKSRVRRGRGVSS